MNTNKPSQDEIIYEFAYTFPKTLGNRIVKILDNTALTIALFVAVYWWWYFFEMIFVTSNYVSLSDFLWGGIFAFILIVFLWCIIRIVDMLLLQPHSKILLTQKGMYVKSVSFMSMKLWYDHRFYEYGSFGAYIGIGGGQIGSFGILKIYGIHKRYSIFARNAKMYMFADNRESQDEKQLISLLREKTREALEKQGIECHNAKEIIQHLYIKEF
ncbi:hypothetical protein [uncultured Helicobacter sp.]|uniref:hypothetical protein n=1 Tax=uncultured Helicobacter sp. TaxID=175537 RepID=UPI003752A5B9